MATADYRAAAGQPAGAVNGPHGTASKAATAPGTPAPAHPGPPPPPGHGQITITRPAGPCWCSSATHRPTHIPAEAIFAIGELGAATDENTLWQHHWGTSFPLCRECSTIMARAARRHPGLAITDHTTPRRPAQPPRR